MSDKLMDSSCSSFAAALAAKESVPGGGGAMAYSGALAAALCSMVGNFTTGKQKYAQYEDDIQRMLAEAEQSRLRLIELVDQDAAAFYPLSQAYGIPKDDPARADTLEQATKGALEPPVAIMREVCKVIDLLEEMGKKGSHMLFSDVGCGAFLARAALEGAYLNVFINTKSLRDRDFADKVERECDRMLRAYAPRTEAIAAQVMADVVWRD